MGIIDISNYNVIELIIELWKYQPSCEIIKNLPLPEPSADLIISSLNNKYKYIDFICGKPIKTSFIDLENVDTNGYNQIVGDNAFETVLSNFNITKQI